MLRVNAAEVVHGACMSRAGQGVFRQTADNVHSMNFSYLLPLTEHHGTHAPARR